MLLNGSGSSLSRLVLLSLNSVCYKTAVMAVFFIGKVPGSESSVPLSLPENSSYNMSLV